jgi:hypothetical protein
MAPLNTNIYPTDKMLTREMPAAAASVDKCRICVYRIVFKQSSTPFIEYLLYKSNDDETLRFPMTHVGDAHGFYEKYIGGDAKKQYRGNCVHDGVLHVFYHYNSTSIGLIENPYKTKADDL